MKNFLRIFILFIFPILILSIAAELSLRNIPNDYSNKKNYLDENSNEIQTLILGNSHTFYGVNPEFISEKSFNAAMVSQSLDYDYKILKKYNENWGNLKTIVIPISYHSLFGNLENGIEYWRIKNYNIYYDMYDGGELKNLTEILSTPFRSNISRVIDYYIIDKKPRISNFGWGVNQVQLIPFNLEEKGRKAAERHTKESDELLETNLKIIQNIISLAEQYNWNILFVTPPAHITYRKYLNLDQLNLTIEKITNLTNLSENAKYYNFIDSPEFSQEDFYDSDHLNAKGAKKFTFFINKIIQGNFFNYTY
jgi:hypothetical protein